MSAAVGPADHRPVPKAVLLFGGELKGRSGASDPGARVGRRQKEEKSYVEFKVVNLSVVYCRSP